MYKGIPCKLIRRIFFTGKSFVNFFLIFKLESDFFPHFLSNIRKLENSAQLFILNYNWAAPPQNRNVLFPFFLKKSPAIKKAQKIQSRLGTFLLHKFVDIEIDKNVHQQKCARARPSWVTKSFKVQLGHIFVDTLMSSHFCRYGNKLSESL